MKLKAKSLLSTLAQEIGELTSVLTEPVKGRTEADVEAEYVRRSSFTDRLPWAEFIESDNLILFEDLASFGATYNLSPRPTDGRPQDILKEYRDTVQRVINMIHQDEDSPWVVQFYAYKEPDYPGQIDELADYVNVPENAFSSAYLAELQSALRDMCVDRPDGMFFDDSVTGAPYVGGTMCHRMVVYQRLSKSRRKDKKYDAYGKIKEVLEVLENAFEAGGIKISRMNELQFRAWMTRWFNPSPSLFENTNELIRKTISGGADRPIGTDLADSVLFGSVRSSVEDGAWFFDEVPHRFIPVETLTMKPKMALVTGETRQGEDYHSTMMDRLPVGSMFSMTITILPQTGLKDYFTALKAKTSRLADDGGAFESAAIAEEKTASGNFYHKAQIGVFIRAKSVGELDLLSRRVASVLSAEGMMPIDYGYDVLKLNTYIRNLPMCYEPLKEKITKRSSFYTSQHLANMIPVYGRSRGSGKPGLLFHNRGGELYGRDPFKKTERSKNAHMFILGPTGAGKSATLVYLMMHYLAMYRPRIFIVEAGASFAPLTEYAEQYGVKTQSIKLAGDGRMSMMPFAYAFDLLKDDSDMQKDRIEGALDTEELYQQAKEAAQKIANEEEEEDGEIGLEKDVLGEMELQARLMITGGDPKEDARYTRSDGMLVREALYKAAENCQASGKGCVLPEDVADALNAMRDDDDIPGVHKTRLWEMSKAMMKWTEGLRGKLFNSNKGIKWEEDADWTHIDLAAAVGKGNEDVLATTYFSILNQINYLAEKYQNENRPIIFLTDEGHIITKNPLLAPGVVKVVKMWRKLGCWFWLATQNVVDFPDESEVLLSLSEWWLLLAMEKDDITQLERFKSLSSEQKAMMSSCRKRIPKYTEGVLLGTGFIDLFRVVSPSIALSLAGSESEEKKERMDVMKRFNLSSVAHACEIIARQYDYQRNFISKEEMNARIGAIVERSQQGVAA